jgi:hypothetical protein
MRAAKTEGLAFYNSSLRDAVPTGEAHRLPKKFRVCIGGTLDCQA